MVKVFKDLLNKCIDNLSNDDEIKFKIENDILVPIIQKSYIKMKPYLLTMIYMYCTIVLLLIIIIMLILFKKK
jgi:hypothetical protein